MPLTALLAGLLALPAAAAAPAAVSFKTADGWTLAASYRPAAPGKPVVVLAHGVGAGKGEWEALASALAARGAGSLAVDLRGHGGSVMGPRGRADWKGFDAVQEWKRAPADLAAAAKWLAARGVPASRVAFGGASIGANLASAAAGKETPFLLLLSPAADYRGVPLSLRPGLKTLAVAAPDDGYSWSFVRQLPPAAGLRTLKAPSGHGAPMLGDAATMNAVLDWVAPAAAAGGSASGAAER